MKEITQGSEPEERGEAGFRCSSEGRGTSTDLRGEPRPITGEAKGIPGKLQARGPNRLKLAAVEKRGWSTAEDQGCSG